jgi:hypothetical protein
MIDILLVLFLGRSLGHNLLQWWIKQQNSPSNPQLVYIDDSIWPETNDNWHENSIEGMEWQSPNIWDNSTLTTATNGWEAATLPPTWWTNLPPPSNTLPLQEQQQAKYCQIENLKP